MANDLLEQMVVHQELARRAGEATAWRQASLAATASQDRPRLGASLWTNRLRSITRLVMATGHARRREAVGCTCGCACCLPGPAG